MDFQAGKDRKKLKVKNAEKYSFKPAQLVSGICRIYLNFKEREGFCVAVCKDGRFALVDSLNMYSYIVLESTCTIVFFLF